MRTPKRRRKLLAALAVAAAVASAVAGCGGGPATDGPLVGGALGSITGGADCVPAHVGQSIAFGDERFTNHGHATIVLERVALLHPYHERLVHSVAVPGRLLIGVANWPPNYAGLPPTWKDRQPVHGFRLAPGQSFNMVLAVTATATGRANSRGMLIYYHDSAGRYVTSNDFAMIIAAMTERGCK